MSDTDGGVPSPLSDSELLPTRPPAPEPQLMDTDEDLMPPPPDKDKRQRETGNTPVQYKPDLETSDVDTDYYIVLVAIIPMKGSKKMMSLAVLSAYSVEVAGVCTTLLDLPVLPRTGQGRNGLGTRHCIYGLTRAECEAIVTAVPLLNFVFEGAECSYAAHWESLKAPAPPLPDQDFGAKIARQKMLQSADWRPEAPHHDRREDGSVHIAAYCLEGTETQKSDILDAVRALRTLGFIVTNKSRPNTTFGEDKQQIEGCKGDVLHFNVTPPTATAWFQKLRFTSVYYDKKSGEMLNLDCALRYHILDDKLEKIVRCFGTCHQLIDLTSGLCPCKENGKLVKENLVAKDVRLEAQAAGRKQAAGVRGPGAWTGRPWANGPRVPVQPTATVSFLAGIGLAPGKLICQHVALGKCYRATSDSDCNFKHPDESLLGTIMCKRGPAKTNPELCRNGPKCQYKHEKRPKDPKSLNFGSTSSDV